MSVFTGTCAECGHAFSREFRGGPYVPRYCSDRCKGTRARRECPSLIWRKDAICKVVYSECRHCGKLMAAPRPRSWCSGRCKRLGCLKPKPLFDCAECGKRCRPGRDGVNHLSEKFCSTRCRDRFHFKRSVAQRMAAKRRRRARKRGARVESYKDIEIWERDGYRCGICGEPTERQRPNQYRPLAPTIDHIVPLVAGGTDEPANVQCAHWLCNSLKGDRLVG
jgi:endogenous inhibitor of DNA gyrase (YacG/DUF329 family)